MIEMEYKPIRLTNPIVLANGTKGKYVYFVLNMGTHPCAYVGIPKGSRFYNVSYDMVPVLCHGGLTFGEIHTASIFNNTEERYFIGWDYGHLGDFIGYALDDFIFDIFDLSDDNDDKKWTTSEMVEECLDVIDQLERLG